MARQTVLVSDLSGRAIEEGKAAKIDCLLMTRAVGRMSSTLRLTRFRT
jgi:hypothetical protein